MPSDTGNLPSSRADAKAVGSKHYFTGKQCKHGHIDKRSTHTGRCMECDRQSKLKERTEKPDIVRARRKAFRENNIDKERERDRLRSRERYANNPGARLSYNKAWREKNADKERQRGRDKYQRMKLEKPESILASGRKRDERRRSTPKGKLECAIKSGVHRGIKQGSKSARKTFALLGYTVDDLISHLEKLFKPEMNLDNYGEWHIDHKIPLSVFNYETPDDIDFKRAWALSNLQPLWASENISKHAKLEGPFQPSLAIAA